MPVITQVQGRASGSLYLDDGRTFAHREGRVFIATSTLTWHAGAYTYRSFVFAGNTLTATAGTPPRNHNLSAQKSTFDTKCKVGEKTICGTSN